MLYLVTVHTSGINWDGVLGNAAATIVIIGTFAALIVRIIRRSIKDEIHDVITSEIVPQIKGLSQRVDLHDTDIARLKGIEEGKALAVAQAGLPSSPNN